MTGGSGETSRQVNINYQQKHEQVRTFIEDGKEQTHEHFVEDSDLWLSLMKSSLTDKLDHNLIDICQRTYQIGRFSIPSGTAPGTILFTYDPANIFTNIINISDKLTGFLCYEADLEIEVRYNVEPQAVGGIALMQYYPQAKSLAEKNNMNGNQTLWSPLSTPINLLTETSSKTSIKYLSTSMTYSANTSTDVANQGFWPLFQVMCWSSYISPTTTALNLAVYARLTNLKPMIPVIPGISPPTTLKAFAPFFKLYRSRLPYTISSADVKLVNDMATKMLSLEAQGNDKELKEEENFVRETIKNADALIQGLPSMPVIKEIQEFSAKAVPVANSVAGFFGYAKPENHSKGDSVEQLNSINMNNIDGSVNAYNLANSAHQRGPVAQLGRDKFDHFSIPQFTGRPAYFNRFTISTTTPVDSVLYKKDISPYRFDASATAGQLIPTPLSYASLPFKYWRGDIIIRLRFFANQFINFNLALGVAYGTPSTLITDTTDLSNIYNVVVDGKQLATYDYRVEFKSQNPWKETYSNLTSFVNPSTSSESVGTFVVKLQNAFTASSSTVTSIDVTVEVFAAENIEFNVLQNIPFSFAVPPSMVAQGADATAPSGDDRGAEAMIAYQKPQPLFSATIFGQSIHSFKSIANTEQFVDEITLERGTGTSGNDASILWPYSLLKPNDDGTTEIPGVYNYLIFITQPFAFLSGDLIVSYFRNSLTLDAMCDLLKYDVQTLPSDIPNLNGVGTFATDYQNNKLYLVGMGSNILIQRTLQSRKVVRAPNYLDRLLFLRPTSDKDYSDGVRNHHYPPGAIVYTALAGPNYTTGFSDPTFIYIRGADNFQGHYFNGLTIMSTLGGFPNSPTVPAP